MSKQTDNYNVIDLLSSKKKAHIKLISNALYQKKIMSTYYPQTRAYVLVVNFKDLVKAVQVASKCIEENNLEVYLWNQKYWQTHAPEFYNSRNNGTEI